MSSRYGFETPDASALGKPLQFEFSGKVAKNRFLKAAMTEQLSSWDPIDIKARGIPSKELVNVYKRWGEGGFGQILTGNVIVNYMDLEAQGNAIIPLDAEFSGPRFEAFSDLATAAKKHGSLLVAQVSHGGRQVNVKIQPNPVSASDVQLTGNIMGKEYGVPHAATQEEINTIIDSFAHAAEYLDKAGFDGIQLHGAHGYLLAQFLSQTTNRRTDKYGGSLENRSRIVTEIAAEIQKRVSPSFILGMKVNSVEFQDKGFSPEEAKAFCQILEASRFDYIELSGGTYESSAFVYRHESTKKREAFFLEFAETIVPSLTKTKSYVTGGLRSVAAMVKSLETVDGIGLARPVTAEFQLPKKILEGKVTGAIKSHLDDKDIGITIVAAGTQIRQVGKDQMPTDFSKEENAQIFFQDMGVWGQKMAEDKEGKEYGFFDLSVPPVPYVE